MPSPDKDFAPSAHAIGQIKHHVVEKSVESEIVRLQKMHDETLIKAHIEGRKN